MSKDIFVAIEQRAGMVQKVSIELLGEARRLAAELNEQVVAVLMGSGVAGLSDMLCHYGADKVLVVDHPVLEHYTTEPYAKAMTHVIHTYDPDIVLFGATSIGRDLAPRVAGRVHTGLTADCTSLAIEEESKLLLMTRPAFGGNIMATIVCKDYRPQMATVRPGVMPLPEKDESRTGEVELVDAGLSMSDMNVEILEINRNEKKSVDITEAKILVSGGRGVGGPEGYQPLRELADVLGGEVSASRVAVDSGWIEKDRQVGQTGKTVRPNLYIACGISGAIQHQAGMEGSEYIVAINLDEGAPMMKLADLGVVGDLSVIVPKLTEAIKAYRAKQAV
ncbi:electron transfer flavoprotein subunit alpha/FixB family protein [Pseudoflavonifractor phocaeensis]|uniref:electron transfer flavoprotein subunit alpha/FixB family protein n=1 Tax=Pseudoflavonifractor phocaeensis TaxID=1870988 RepID=UPI001F46E603|nr:electron transfer flavoprotein subunit alpha/FixB family protein [Pseudoflavonifractor phocaeensis]MCF2662085.1 electron transfer flavoprotein subunit alpha/FixB family protein [Pseudoflavonifractor phocaeensis]